MKFKRFVSYHDNKKFIMEESTPEIGIYIYIYADGKGMYDYLQDSWELCKEFALENFGVPLDSWKEIEPVEWIDGKRIDPLEP